MDHATDFAYAIKFVDEDKTPEEYLSKENVKDFLYKYTDYLFKYDKETLYKLVFNKLYDDSGSYNLNIIYRPSLKFEGLYQKGTLGIKFTRSQNDDL